MKYVCTVRLFVDSLILKFTFFQIISIFAVYLVQTLQIYNFSCYLATFEAGRAPPAELGEIRHLWRLWQGGA